MHGPWSHRAWVRIRSLVQSAVFNNVIVAVILINAALIGLSTYTADVSRRCGSSRHWRRFASSSILLRSCCDLSHVNQLPHSSAMAGTSLIL